MGEPPLLLRSHSTNECSSILWSKRKGRADKGKAAVEKDGVFFLYIANIPSGNNSYFTVVIKQQRQFA
jgi:hypothetical protein